MEYNVFMKSGVPQVISPVTALGGLKSKVFGEGYDELPFELTERGYRRSLRRKQENLIERLGMRLGIAGISESTDVVGFEKPKRDNQV